MNKDDFTYLFLNESCYQKINTIKKCLINMFKQGHFDTR